MKGSIYHVDGATSKLQLPAKDKDSLGLLQPFLVFQVYIPSDGKQKNQFKIEIIVTDVDKNKRRLIFHSGGHGQEITINQFHARIPTHCFLRDVWLNMSIDVFAFAHHCFKGVQVKSIDGISLTS